MNIRFGETLVRKVVPAEYQTTADASGTPGPEVQVRPAEYFVVHTNPPVAGASSVGLLAALAAAYFFFK